MEFDKKDSPYPDMESGLRSIGWFAWGWRDRLWYPRHGKVMYVSTIKMINRFNSCLLINELRQSISNTERQSTSEPLCWFRVRIQHLQSWKSHPSESRSVRVGIHCLSLGWSSESDMRIRVTNNLRLGTKTQVIPILEEKNNICSTTLCMRFELARRPIMTVASPLLLVIKIRGGFTLLKLDQVKLYNKRTSLSAHFCTIINASSIPQVSHILGPWSATVVGHTSFSRIKSHSASAW